MKRKESPPLNGTPPLPGSAEDEACREDQRFRRRIMEGRWETDLLDKIRSFWDPAVAPLIVPAMDMSKNLGGRVSTEVAVLYEEQPRVANETNDAAVEDMSAAVAESGLWQLQQGTNRLAYGIREMYVRTDAVQPNGKPTKLAHRLIPPDMVQAYASPDTPDEPNLLFESRPRVVGGKSWWTWDVVDLRDPAAPRYMVLKADYKSDDPDETIEMATDITDEVLGAETELDGARPEGNWLWWAGDEPLWPYPLYHAQRTGKLYDPRRNMEMFYSTVMIGAYYSFLGMGFRDGSYPIRTIYGSVAGVGTRGDGSETRRQATIAPGVVLELMSPDGGTTPPSIDQWGPAIDPERMQMAIEAYEKRAMIDAGLSPSDVDKSGGPESGYSKTVSRESVRRVARAMEVPFRRADEHTLRLSAGLLNRWGGASLPTAGWRVQYRGMEKSPEERRADREQWQADYDLGLVSLVDLAMLRFPHLRDREEAKRMLAEREMERRTFVVQENR